MPLVLVVLVVGSGIGFMAHRRSPHARRATVCLKALAAAAIALLIYVDVASPRASLGLAIVGIAALIVVLGANLTHRGTGVIALGLVLNLVGILAAGAQLVEPEALVRAGIVDASEIDEVRLDGARRLADPGDPLTALGGVIPVPQARTVVSFGDMIVLVGLVAATATFLRSRRRSALPRHAHAVLLATFADRPDSAAEAAEPTPEITTAPPPLRTRPLHARRTRTGGQVAIDVRTDIPMIDLTGHVTQPIPMVQVLASETVRPEPPVRSVFHERVVLLDDPLAADQPAPERRRRHIPDFDPIPID